MLENEIIKEISTSSEKTAAQVLLKFQVTRGVVVIPKSANEERMAKNKDLFSWNFSKEENEKMKSLNNGTRLWYEERVKHSKYFPW